MTSYDTQAARVWQHLRQFGSITEREALLKLGCKRLSARIEDLRLEHGYGRIKTVYGRGVNSASGRRTRYAEKYVYISEAEARAPKLEL